MTDALKWDDLRAFLAVARRGTLAAAAEPLGVDASTVHRRIAALEGALGARLFDRDPRGYTLTPVGEAMLPRAEEAEEAILAARRVATGHDLQAEGVVRLTLPTDLLSVVAPHLAAFRRACPGVIPHLLVDARSYDLGRETEVALRASNTPPDSAVGRRLGRLAWTVYGPAEEPSDDLPWITYVGMDQVAAVKWRQRKHPDVVPLMAVNGVAGMHHLLGCSRARGMLPCYAGDPDSRLRRLCEPPAEAGTDLWLLVHADLRRSARVRALLDFLVPRLEADLPLLEGVVGES